MSGLPSSAAGYPDVEDGSLHSVPLLCQAVPPGPARDAAMTWLSGASGGDAQARTRNEAGSVLVLVDVAAAVDDPPAAAALVLPHEDGAELTVLHAPGPQKAELTRRLLAEVCDALRHGEVTRLVVATANRRLPSPTLLAEAGFRPSTEEGGDWLELHL